MRKSAAGSSGPSDLRSHTRVRRRQLAVGEGRPVLTDFRVEARRARRVDGIIDRLHPFDVGAEAGLTPEIKGEVNAETAGFGHRVDQARERCASGQRVIAALGEKGSRNMYGRQARGARGERDCAETSCIDDPAGQDLGIACVTADKAETVLNDRHPLDRALQRQRSPVQLRLAQQRQHQRMRVDDSSRRRQQGGDAFEGRFQPRARRSRRAGSSRRRRCAPRRSRCARDRRIASHSWLRSVYRSDGRAHHGCSQYA